MNQRDKYLSKLEISRIIALFLAKKVGEKIEKNVNTSVCFAVNPTKITHRIQTKISYG